MTNQRQEIVSLIEELTAFLEKSAAAPASKTIAALMVASVFARRTHMPPELAAAMLANFYVKGPLAPNDDMRDGDIDTA